MDLESRAGPAAIVTIADAPRRPGGEAVPGPPASVEPEDPSLAVTALYHEHALSLIRVAHIMLGNRAAAEDVVQDAFCGLYRRWGHLATRARLSATSGHPSSMAAGPRCAAAACRTET